MTDTTKQAVLPLRLQPQVTIIQALWHWHDHRMGSEKGACSTGLHFCLCQLGNTSLVLPWQCRSGLEWDSPSSAPLWEAGVRPASGAPIWSYDNRGSISTYAPGFSWLSLTHLWNTRHGCEYDKRVLMLMQHPFNQPATVRTSWLKKALFIL